MTRAPNCLLLLAAAALLLASELAAACRMQAPMAMRARARGGRVAANRFGVAASPKEAAVIAPPQQVQAQPQPQQTSASQTVINNIHINPNELGPTHLGGHNLDELDDEMLEALLRRRRQGHFKLATQAQYSQHGHELAAAETSGRQYIGRAPSRRAYVAAPNAAPQFHGPNPNEYYHHGQGPGGPVYAQGSGHLQRGQSQGHQHLGRNSHLAYDEHDQLGSGHFAGAQYQEPRSAQVSYGATGAPIYEDEYEHYGTYDEEDQFDEGPFDEYNQRMGGAYLDDDQENYHNSHNLEGYGGSSAAAAAAAAAYSRLSASGNVNLNTNHVAALSPEVQSQIRPPVNPPLQPAQPQQQQHRRHLFQGLGRRGHRGGRHRYHRY